jgi:outer membrane translocation and assembly module TamA
VRLASFVTLAMLALAPAGLAGCKERPPKVPGETDVLVAAVHIEPAAPATELALPHKDLYEKLGMRPASLILTERTWSPFREAEDRRRIEAYWQGFGYFDVSVAEPKVETTADGKKEITWRVREGDRYAIGDVRLQHAPPDQEEALREKIPFEVGTREIDFEKYRDGRIVMQEYLRVQGYGHANVYSRSWVDKSKKSITWVYFVDAGPKTKIGAIVVDGNRRVSSESILERAGIRTGEPYTEDLRESIVRDLLDTGSFESAYVRVDTDTKFIPPGTLPDTGGELRDEQIDAQGNLVPRKLPEDVMVTIHVVEGRTRTLRLGATFEIDPARADTGLGAKVWFRDLFGSMDHLVLEGRVGYGLWLDGIDRNDGQDGLYGEALVRTVHAGALGRTGDLRLSARVRHEPFPDSALREFSAGPGARFNLDKGLFIDLDLLGVYAQSLGFGPFSAAERAALSLPDDDEAGGPQLDAAITWDARNDGIEPMRGHLLRLATRLSPGEPVATNRWFDVSPDARVYLPLSDALSIGLRGSAGFVMGDDEHGIPLGGRLFGGGAYGFRGLGRKQLAPVTFDCVAPPGGTDICHTEIVGGASLAETSAELRFLKPRSQVGAVAFFDLAGASGNLNPFDVGPSLAAGLGGRLRLWYLPLAIDVGWRFVEDGETVALDDDPIAVFFRLGEAF